MQIQIHLLGVVASWPRRTGFKQQMLLLQAYNCYKLFPGDRWNSFFSISFCLLEMLVHVLPDHMI